MYYFYEALHNGFVFYLVVRNYKTYQSINLTQ